MDFHGYPVRRLENKFLYVDYLTEAGPRLVRLGAAGSTDNLLVELPNFTMDTPFGEYRFFGGHRLWHAPEAMPRSYLPDSSGLVVKESPNGVTLTQPVETGSGLRKAMTLRLAPDSPRLTIEHTLTNASLWPVECAPWAITQIKLGGIAIIPQQLTTPEPALLPDRMLTIWNYTRLQDPRLHLGDDYILIDGAPGLPPCKIGTPNPAGWAAYLTGEVLFVKRFEHLPRAAHVDNGCDTEVYVNDQFIEVETLGALVLLQPGETVAHTETWELHTGVKGDRSSNGIRAILKSMGL